MCELKKLKTFEKIVSFRCVDIEIECRNISISADIGGVVLSTL